jgi:hypothetical protein
VVGMRIGRVGVLIAIGAMLAGMADPPRTTYERLAGEARAARERQDYPTYVARIRAMADLLPGHPVSHYSLARALSLNGDRQGAIDTLISLADWGFAYDPGADPAFAGLRGDPRFAAAGRRLAANKTPRGGPATAAALGLAGQQPEGVARIGEDTFLIGTLDGMIYRYAAQQGQTPHRLVSMGWAVAGIRPDESTGTFLACVTDEAGGRALVQRHRLADGALVAMYPLPSSGAFCNDIALTAAGFAVTDSNNGLVFELRGNRLGALPLAPLFYPNGIASNPDGGKLFVAHGNGVLSLDRRTGEAVTLAPEGSLLGGIDGMVWHDGALIAMQNVVEPPRLLRITPGSDGRPARVEPIFSASPQLAGATTVTVEGGEVLVLSQTGIPNGTLPDDPILLRVPL